MRLLGSLRSRVFAATALVAVLPIAAALLLVTRSVRRQAEAELSLRLQEAVRLVDQYHRTRLDAGARAGRAVRRPARGSSPRCYEADPGTAEPIARDYRERVRADVFVVADRSGRTLGVARDARDRLAGGRLALPRGRSPAARDRGECRSCSARRRPRCWARLTLGFALDDAFAVRLRALTGSEVAVVRGPRVFASTLARSEDAALAARAARHAGEPVDLGGEEYGAARAALGDDAQAPVVLVLRSRAEALRPLRTLRAALAAAASGRSPSACC